MKKSIRRPTYAQVKLWVVALTLVGAYCAISYGLGMLVGLNR